tara:strand:- start:20 stop:214 length:195 start_codon:yes stop_codon:yes gene_type:complete
MAYLRDESDYKGLFSDCKTVKQVKEQAIKALKWRDKSIYEYENQATDIARGHQAMIEQLMNQIY